MRFVRSILVIASLAGSLLPTALTVRADEVATSDADALRAEVAALKAQLAAREAELKKIEARNATLEQDLSTVRSAVAFAGNSTTVTTGGPISPSSTLAWTDALKVATAARFMVKGASLVTVMPTGSMKPVFDERSILLTEPAAFDDLKPGDIVTYRHPKHGLPVVHRILEKRGDKFWAKGDNNGRMDDVWITRDNYEARVFGIIYANEASTQAKRFTPTTVPARGFTTTNLSTTSR